MKTVTALNTVSGKVGVVPETYLTHPVLGKTLVEVEEGTKSYEPSLYRTTDKDGDAAKPTRGRRRNTVDEDTQPTPEPDEVPEIAGDQPNVTSDPENL